MWRSEPPCSTIDFSNWFKVGGMTTDSSDRLGPANELCSDELDRQKLASVYTIEGIDERA
jgi:hypothetical protein